MKSPLFLAFACLLLAGCQSGDLRSRTDFSDASFDTLSSRVNDRASYLMNLDPNLTKEQALSQASVDLGAERRKERKRQRAAQAQRNFEQKLAQSLRR